jgi:hypothetical protein
LSKSERPITACVDLPRLPQGSLKEGDAFPLLLDDFTSVIHHGDSIVDLVG